MLDAPRYPAVVRLLRAMLLFKLGFWSGTFASAALLKRAFPSRGDEGSDEVRLVAILNGVAIKSHATAFRGGSMLSWLGGIAVDLREAQLAPEAHIEVASLFGGIAIRVPPGWRVESEVRALGGGVAVDVPEPDADAPVLRVTGFSAFGGVAVGAKPTES
jgi:Cell wall-active antibiotics response 4TMS YvqF